jgi:ATP-binding protein involved in chromosome partitioning
MNLAGVRAIVAIASARGGVGKSTLTVNIAAALAMAGRKVGIVDADLNSPSIVAMLGMKPGRRLETVGPIEPASGPLGLRVAGSNLLADGEPSFSFLDDQTALAGVNGAHPTELSYSATLRRLMAETQFGALDALLIDLAPGLDQLYLLCRIVSPDAVIMVSQPSGHAAHALANALEVAAHMSAPVLGIVENMVGFSCGSCRSVRPLVPQGGVGALARERNVPVLARLPFDPRLAESCDHGVPFVRDYSDTPLGKQFVELAQRLEKMFVACAAGTLST